MRYYGSIADSVRSARQGAAAASIKCLFEAQGSTRELHRECKASLRVSLDIYVLRRLEVAVAKWWVLV